MLLTNVSYNVVFLIPLANVKAFNKMLLTMFHNVVFFIPLANGEAATRDSRHSICCTNP